MCKKSGLTNYKFLALLWLLALAVTGCSDDLVFDTADTDSGTSAGVDTSTDAGTGNGIDTGTTSGADANGSTSTDGGNDSGTGVDTVGVDTEIGADTENAADTDAGSETGSTDGVDIGTDAGTNEEAVSTVTTLGEANCPPLVGAGDTSSIAGLYNATDSEIAIDTPAGPTEQYLEISDTGNATFYIYLPSTIDQELNCFLVARDVWVFSPLGSDMYTGTIYVDTDKSCETISEAGLILRGETQISFINPDHDDVDNDGDTTELLTQIIPEALGLSSESFNPCIIE